MTRAMIWIVAALELLAGPTGADTPVADRPSGLSGLTMDQQMAKCAQLRQQVARDKIVQDESRKTLAACDAMDRQMQMPAATKAR